MRTHRIATMLSIAALPLRAQTPARPPIIDVHLHALPANGEGPPPQKMCFGDTQFVPVDPREGVREVPLGCPHPVFSPKTDEELMRASLAALERYNVVGIASGPIDIVQRWRTAAPRRIIPGIAFNSPRQLSADSLRALVAAKVVAVVGDVGTEYAGISPDDPALEPYWTLAEELDVPVGIHMGLGPPGAPYIGLDKYRGRFSNPLLLEDVLVKHPKLRVYVMHAGWPMLDAMLHLLYTHPQVYVDVGVIDFVLPKAEFYRYLRTLVDAGFGKRIMFGSDQMVWPQAIGEAIGRIESAPFLTPAQKRDILYNNAARFLRLAAPSPR